MSNTPETANAVFAASDVHEDCGVVYAEFAEQLERERDEARFDLAFRRELYAIQELQLLDANKTILELQKK